MTDVYIGTINRLDQVLKEERTILTKSIIRIQTLIKDKHDSAVLERFYTRVLHSLTAPEVDEAHMLFIRHLIRLDPDFEPSVKNRQEDHGLPNKPIFRLDS